MNRMQKGAVGAAIMLFAATTGCAPVNVNGPESAGRLGNPSSPHSAAPIEEGYAVTPDGVRLYYRAAGRGPETVIAPFALFHGTSLDALAVGRRVITYDPRGRGRSQAVSPDKVSLDLLLTDLDTVRRAVGAERTAIIGWSGGGMETFVYALRNPGKVTRLVQLAPVTPRFNPYNAEMMADRRRRIDGSAWNALQERVKAGEFVDDPAAHCRAENLVTLPALFADRTKAALVPDVCDSANEHPNTLGAYFGGLFRSIDGFDWSASLPRVTIPRLVIHPLQDNISRTGNEEWVRGQANARILFVDGSGHFPQYERPDETLSAIDTFLKGDWPDEAHSLPLLPGAAPSG
ncbi:MAG TPA: alpha/beta hydrolase [Allosphingosinicella sp.]|uniref:alpha/beta fold hydrolase n=1 Tax=Allosphingosinicella sp. TaxID=2823234 RepID=UPI002ED8C912